MLRRGGGCGRLLTPNPDTGHFVFAEDDGTGTGARLFDVDAANGHVSTLGTWSGVSGEATLVAGRNGRLYAVLVAQGTVTVGVRRSDGGTTSFAVSDAAIWEPVYADPWTPAALYDAAHDRLGVLTEREGGGLVLVLIHFGPQGDTPVTTEVLNLPTPDYEGPEASVPSRTLELRSDGRFVVRFFLGGPAYDTAANAFVNYVDIAPPDVGTANAYGDVVYSVNAYRGNNPPDWDGETFPVVLVVRRGSEVQRVRAAVGNFPLDVANTVFAGKCGDPETPPGVETCADGAVRAPGAWGLEGECRCQNKWGEGWNVCRPCAAHAAPVGTYDQLCRCDDFYDGDPNVAGCTAIPTDVAALCGGAYRTLTDGSRNVSAGKNGSGYLDSLGYGDVRSDWQGSGWYRFSGAAGSRMASLDVSGIASQAVKSVHLGAFCGSGNPFSPADASSATPAYLIEGLPTDRTRVVLKTAASGETYPSSNVFKLPALACDGFELYYLFSSRSQAGLIPQVAYCGAD